MSWWKEFFHAPVDLIALGLFRIALGILVVVSACAYGRSARRLLDPDGYSDGAAWRRGAEWRFTVFRFLPDSPVVVRVILVLYGVAGGLLAAGCATTAAATTAFVLAVSIHHRNRFALHSGDALMRVMLLLMIFADSGRALSVCVWESRSASGSCWALRLMQIQVSALYLQSVWFKLKGRTWREGTASHYASRLLSHQKRRLPGWADSRAAHRVATYATLIVEAAGATLIWWGPARWITLAGLGGLHLSLQLLMKMDVFQWTMLASLLVFIPGEQVMAALAALTG